MSTEPLFLICRKCNRRSEGIEVDRVQLAELFECWPIVSAVGSARGHVPYWVSVDVSFFYGGDSLNDTIGFIGRHLLHDLSVSDDVQEWAGIAQESYSCDRGKWE